MAIFNSIVMKMLKFKLLTVLVLSSFVISAKEYHVSVNGSDKSDGSSASPFKTINFVAQLAVPGDVITVHKGTYREWVNPARGGESDTKRIIYQAAKAKMWSLPVPSLSKDGKRSVEIYGN